MMKTMKKMILFFSLIFIFDIIYAQKISFNRDWQFCRLDELKTAQSRIDFLGPDWQTQYLATGGSTILCTDSLKEEQAILINKSWDKVTLPHTPFVEPLVIQKQWQGICYYKKEFAVNSKWRGKKIYIEFGGAMQLSDIWINGQHIMQHVGGYDPFIIDLSKIVKFNSKNEILVRLDNRNNPIVPPGRPIEILDFCYYGGIYRDVNLIIKEPLHITNSIFADKIAGGGIFVTYPTVSKEKALVNIKTNIINESAESARFSIEHTLIELTPEIKNGEKIFREGKIICVQSKGNCVLNKQQDNDFSQELAVNKPKLWSPGSPNLYLLKTEVKYDGKTIDEEKTRIGIRRIEFSKEKGFLINGTPLRLVGTNRHQEYPYVGNAISDRAQYRDIYKIKEGGFNIVRLSHYLQDCSVLEACDELGLLVIAPIPGWQFYNKDTAFCNYTYRDARIMVRRDRNHPSIVMWETMLNESSPSKEWKRHIIAVAHAEYPGDQFYTSGDSNGFDGFDVCYNDWKGGFIRANNTNKPGFIREHYDYEFGGERSTTRIGRGDGEKALLQNAWNAQWSHNRYRAQYPETNGDAVWSMYDYNRGCHNNICQSGVSDIFRLPKFSWWFFRLQLPKGALLSQTYMKPELFIADYWLKKEKADKVIVYGNVDEVELRVNGQTISRQKKDNGPDSPYASDENYYTGGNPFDQGNCGHLNSPPFTFMNVNWAKGNIEAIGFINGKEVTRQKVFTPEEARILNIKVDESGKKWVKENDPVFVYVSIYDKRGTLCVEDSSMIKLSVEGDAQVIGSDEIKAEAGIATFLVRSGNEGGKILLKAQCLDHSKQITAVSDKYEL